MALTEVSLFSLVVGTASEQGRQLFLGDLTNPEKKAFLDLARTMVSIDGTITVEEREMLQDARAEMGFDASEMLPEVEDDLDTICGSVLSPATRAQILLELASFAFVDSDFDARERQFLRSIAERWRFDDISIIRIEDWASRRVDLAREAAEIVLDADIFCSTKDRMS